ncbi:hypothetical protein B224_1916 [Aeromonas media WS]|nr:hypothetical protein B224_1916 [Aeromonas media WS]
MLWLAEGAVFNLAIALAEGIEIENKFYHAIARFINIYDDCPHILLSVTMVSFYIFTKFYCFTDIGVSIFYQLS